MQKQALWNRNFLGICFTNFFLFMTMYSLMNTLPIFVTDVLKADKQQVGLVVTLFLIGAVLIRPLAGKWIENLGPKKILLISLTLFMISNVIDIKIKNFFPLLILRFIQGIGFGMATTATGTIVADLIPDNRKGEGIGYFNMFMSLAMVVGPFLGLTVISHYNFTIFFTICSIFCLLALLCGNITKTPEHISNKKTKTNKSLQLKDFIEPTGIPISLISFVLSFGYYGSIAFITLYAKEIRLANVSSFFFVVFAVMIVISRPFFGKLFDKRGENIVIYPGFLLLAIGLIGLSKTHTPFMFLASSGIIGLGFGALFSSLQALVLKAAPAHRKGFATATFLSFWDCGYGLGSFLLGLISVYTGYSILCVVSSVIILFDALLYYKLHHRKTVTFVEHTSKAA
ncbi:MFS transporter [Clostridium polyendosporum]|uniref:MFS transporter n=1 Tax=Clostridium polyendosporum TaxID=69208 RepID=A0A919VDL8_9CLOT|nr:MFS transporter [Clostridium polyendosporum]GIM28154.1 MFS transporter [Clostridium polyendosporum]